MLSVLSVLSVLVSMSMSMLVSMSMLESLVGILLVQGFFFTAEYILPTE
jgi:hypothetical protein